MPRTLAAVEAELALKTHQARRCADYHPKHAELHEAIDALLEERHRLRTPLRPSQVLAAGR